MIRLKNFLMIGRPKYIGDLRDLQTGYSKTERGVAEIAIVDDEEFPYLEILTRHDFRLKALGDITDIRAVAEYPVILCDIKGVGKHFGSSFEGAHLISEVKKKYPAKVVYAYTGHQIDPSFNKYFRFCDAVVKKDISSDEWVEQLDKAIQLATNPIDQWLRLRTYLLRCDIPLQHLLILEDDYVTKVMERTLTFPKIPWKVFSHLKQN